MARQSAAPIAGGPPGTNPSACTGARYLRRVVVNAVMWRTRTGSPWRDLPPVYGRWKTVYNRHRRWSGDGTWIKVLDGLRVGADLDAGAGEWVVGVDAAVIRAHHHAAGARHAPPGDVAEAVLAPAVLTGG